MPVFLPPISRRRFLSSSIAAAALALSQGCALSSSRKNANGVALLSDIHIAADPAKMARNVNMTTNLRAVIEEAIAWPQPLSNVFVNGDLAFDDGTAPDYGAVLKLLRPMREAGLPIHLGMGNHDNRENFWSTAAAEKSAPAGLPDRQATIVRLGTANWFMLDSLIKTRITPGLLGKTQLSWLARALDANSGKPAIIMVHHQPGTAPAPGKAGSGLEDTAELMAILRPRPQVKAYFFGHTHHWHVRQDQSGIHLVNLPPTAYLFEEGLPNGWVHADVHDTGARLELRCLDRSHKDHGQVVNLAWRTA